MVNVPIVRNNLPLDHLRLWRGRGRGRGARARALPPDSRPNCLSPPGTHASRPPEHRPPLHGAVGAAVAAAAHRALTRISLDDPRPHARDAPPARGLGLYMTLDEHGGGAARVRARGSLNIALAEDHGAGLRAAHIAQEGRSAVARG